MKRYVRITALLLALLLLAACGAPAVGQAETDGRAIRDCAGRKVTLPEEVNTIACLYAYTGHVSVLLGCEDKIVAVVKGLKRDEMMERKVPGLEDLPCPYVSGSINIEELAAAAPDLIFVRLENLQDDGEVQKLDNLGIPYLVVDYVTMEDQIGSIEMMASALGEEPAGDAYLSYYRDTLAMVRGRLEALPEAERKTVYHSVTEVVRTDIPGTLSYEVLEAAGCRNVITAKEELRLDGDKGMASVEQIYVWDPDVVLANEPSAVEYFRTDSKFSGLRAVTEGSVFQLPIGISRWAHPGSLESPLAALYIAKLLYPELFEDIDIREEVRTFYSEFFRLPLSEEDIDSILSGNGMRTAKEGGFNT